MKKNFVIFALLIAATAFASNSIELKNNMLNLDAKLETL